MLKRIKPQTVYLPPHGTRKRLESALRVAVVGGGIAGISAATILAERGAQVTLLEREGFWGGRAGSWTESPADGDDYQMERGFHAFFRQYYNLRALLTRVDPDLNKLALLEDYPILGPSGMMASFKGLPSHTPFNLVELVRRSSYFRLADLGSVNVPAALQMLTYDPVETYARHGDQTANHYLNSLGFPDSARQMFFNVFSHSFFNREEAMSAAEMLAMFHFYFTGNPEGLVFDVSREPMSAAFWDPLARRLEGLGSAEYPCQAQLGQRVDAVRRVGGEWVVETEQLEVPCDALVLALSVPALKNLLANSPDLASAAPGVAASVDALSVTLPFYVLRLWLGRPVRSDRSPFAGTTGIGRLDNISIYNYFQRESANWAEREGGSVVELHAYAVDEDAEEVALREDLLDGLHRFYPETRGAEIIREYGLLRRDCAGFEPGSHRARPTVHTGREDLALAGDFVRMNIPSALMERAAISGILAANTLLASHGVAAEPIKTVPPIGLLRQPALFEHRFLQRQRSSRA